MKKQPTKPRTPEERLSYLVSRLRAKGHRITPQRLAIMREFLSDTTHPTAEEIYDRLHDLFPTMALTTVHNTLRLLVDMGEALELTPSAPAARFDPRPWDHCHIICINCEKIVDVDDCGAVDWQALENLAQQKGFVVLNQVHEIYGLCPECRTSSNHTS